MENGTGNAYAEVSFLRLRARRAWLTKIFALQWASSGQGVGATLTLTWSSAINILQVILFDRPNLSDQITGGTLTFAPSGSVVTFGELANNGGATKVTLASAVSATSVTMKVTSVSSTTGNVGLAEIQVYGPSSG